VSRPSGMSGDRASKVPWADPDASAQPLIWNRKIPSSIQESFLPRTTVEIIGGRVVSPMPLQDLSQEWIYIARHHSRWMYLGRVTATFVIDFSFRTTAAGSVLPAPACSYQIKFISSRAGTAIASSIITTSGCRVRCASVAKSSPSR
jgi:hypothetical protein